MARKSWYLKAHKNWHLNDHVVELKHGYCFGAATVTVDGKPIFKRPLPSLYLDFGFAHRFEIDGLPCAVRVVCQFYNYRYEFLTGEDAECVKEANRLPMDRQSKKLFIYWIGIMFVAFCFFCATIIITAIMRH